jgi:hypothetical protein
VFLGLRNQTGNTKKAFQMNPVLSGNLSCPETRHGESFARLVPPKQAGIPEVLE